MKNIKIRNLIRGKNDRFYVIDKCIHEGITYYLVESENYGEERVFLANNYVKEENSMFAICLTYDDLDTTLSEL